MRGLQWGVVQDNPELRAVQPPHVQEGLSSCCTEDLARLAAIKPGHVAHPADVASALGAEHRTSSTRPKQEEDAIESTRPPLDPRGAEARREAILTKERRAAREPPEGSECLRI
mmetsp:Transcript_10153/g.29590  ORF Transcript_10153/g.29590 Transcript_10153/m.29590 type:complete len:114 (-) Transcript_10153:6517-6858(-)|eukprot:scaffold6705_cov31-Tisochrysis_lutea.AAC.2